MLESKDNKESFSSRSVGDKFILWVIVCQLAQIRNPFPRSVFNVLFFLASCKTEPKNEHIDHSEKHHSLSPFLHELVCQRTN